MRGNEYLFCNAATGHTDARELLVLKLLEERRKNAARLQHQLTQQSTSSKSRSLDETTTETEIESEGERDFEDSTNSESTGNGRDERVFHYVDARANQVHNILFNIFVFCFLLSFIFSGFLNFI